MIQHRLTRPLPLAALLLAASPALLLFEFFAYVVRARLYLGHWPYYNHPDPKQLGWWIQHSLLQAGFVGFPFAAIAAAFLAAVGRARSREFPIWTIIATAVVASAVLITFARIDPGGFMDWFWD
jgi:hypothetical protein